MPENKEFSWSCPLPAGAPERILLGHGGGGRLTQDLIEGLFLPAFGDASERHDGAILELHNRKLAFTTDSYVVRPLFFPGGDIGCLAVNGTVNDLAMCGARPLSLSCGFILEEGLPIEDLRRVVESMRAAARLAGVAIATGDTKVVDKGHGDGIFVNTSGIGLVESPRPIRPEAVRAGDSIIISGDLGAHGVAILSVRESLEFDSPIVSDTAPLWTPVRALLDAGVEIHCLRDLTRGGLSSALNEIAETARIGIEIEEAAVPVSESVQGACEILGLDPLYVANEGRFVAFLPAAQADRAVDVLHGCLACERAVLAGMVTGEHPGKVVLKSSIGGRRVLDMLSGEQLPRIC